METVKELHSRVGVVFIQKGSGVGDTMNVGIANTRFILRIHRRFVV